MKRTKLIIDYDYNFSLLGLVCPLKDYKFAWTLNKRLQLNLIKQNDLSIEIIGGNSVNFSRFLHQTEYHLLWVIKNKSVDSEAGKLPYLVPELNHLDYLIKIEGEGDSYPIDQVLQGLREEINIQLVQEVPVLKLKNKDNLLF